MKPFTEEMRERAEAWTQERLPYLTKETLEKLIANNQSLTYRTALEFAQAALESELVRGMRDALRKERCTFFYNGGRKRECSFASIHIEEQKCARCLALAAYNSAVKHGEG